MKDGRLLGEGNTAMMAVLEHLVGAGLCANHFMDIITLRTTLKEKCDLSFTGEEVELRLGKVMLTKGRWISNSGPFCLSLKVDLLECPPWFTL